MKTKCPYCDYVKQDEPLSLPLMRVILDEPTNSEDYILWFRRLMDVHYKKYGHKTYRGVKVHIGRIHKGELNWPTFEYNKEEKDLMERATNNVTI